MSIRKLEILPAPKLYKDEYSIDSILQESKGLKISDNEIFTGNISDMTEGELQVDFKNKRQVIKIKGSLYKQTIEDSNVVLTKIN